MNFFRYAILIPGLISMTFAAEEEGDFSPAALRIVQHLPTPLRKESLSFQMSWEPISNELPGNYFGEYINTIIREDGIGKSLKGDEKMPSYGSIPFRKKKVRDSDWQDFWEQASKIFETLEDESNPFGFYFQGVFTFYGYTLSQEDEDTQKNIKGKARQLLNKASENHYVRATQFMLKHNLWSDKYAWDDNQITQDALEIREAKILAPHKIISQHIKTHKANGTTSWKEINTLKKLLDLLPGEPKQHEQIFSLWANDLANRLTLCKKRDSLPLPATLLLAYTFSSSLVYGANCISNLDKGNSDEEPYNVAIGVTQGLASVTGIITGIANTPSFLNLWYSSNFRSLDGSWTWPQRLVLLPSSYSSEEIARQSYLIALYGILYNKVTLLEGETPESAQSQKYIEKLRKLTLSSYQGYYPAALSTVITKKEEENFNL
ncbi:hypothetical protein [Candidatus Paracaedibacter symbiosus]|uniref:hypothetical protein n=1 Tax=Candidatus Paracaedibacter symbiosus TaxID=244582 RepID=UPI000509AE9D|nr:hypothetical protein [Candidatus Paracaedibacter symbiosus]